jgi:hypothetical protein
MPTTFQSSQRLSEMRATDATDATDAADATVVSGSGVL